MTDPEESEAKNEQELNLFSDQPATGATPAESDGNEPYVLEPDDPVPETPEEPETGIPDAPAKTAFPGAEASFEPEDLSEIEDRERSIPARNPDDSPVVAPPPPRKKQPAPIRPGIVVAPRAVRPAGQPVSLSDSASAQKYKPLPHALQPDQSLGQMLVSIRNARGMSLDEVAGFTRFRKEYLVELEADEPPQNLTPVYISAYVRKLAEVYDLSPEDSGILLKRMRKDIPQDPEEIPKTFLETVNENTLVNEKERKRIRNYSVVFYVAIGIVSVAVLWLVLLAVIRYARASEPVPGRDPATATSLAAQPAEEPISQTVHIDESELDALIVPETPSISVLKMSKVPGVRESL